MPEHRVFVDGHVHVRRTMCATCIGHPDNRMQLHPERVAGMLAGCEASGGVIPCHEHLHVGAPIEPVCRWFYDHHATPLLQVADRLGYVLFVNPSHDDDGAYQDEDEDEL